MKFAIAIIAALMVNNAYALTIFAKLESFEGANTSFNGGSPGGGIGTFSIQGGDTLSSNLAFLESAPTFEAICLEPQEFISTGQTYVFNVVPLSAGPTNPGPMGVTKATAFLEAMEIGGFNRVEDITGANAINFAQIASWEASQELVGGFDPTAGSAVVSGIGQGDVVAASLLFDGNTNLDGYALLNIGVVGPSLRTLYTGQDFAVFNNVPTPAPLFLFGLGLIGVGYVMQKRQSA